MRMEFPSLDPIHGSSLPATTERIGRPLTSECPMGAFSIIPTNPEVEFHTLCTQWLPAVRWFDAQGYKLSWNENKNQRDMAALVKKHFPKEMSSQECGLKAWQMMKEPGEAYVEFLRIFKAHEQDYDRANRLAEYVGKRLEMWWHSEEEKFIRFNDPAFQSYPEISVIFTLFGVGGTYDAGNPNRGVVYVRPDCSQRASGGEGPTDEQRCTFLGMHELVHTLIENRVVSDALIDWPSKDHLRRMPHWAKERLVDLLLLHVIQVEGGDPRQEQGDPRVDAFFNKFLLFRECSLLDAMKEFAEFLRESAEDP